MHRTNTTPWNHHVVTLRTRDRKLPPDGWSTGTRPCAWWFLAIRGWLTVCLKFWTRWPQGWWHGTLRQHRGLCGKPTGKTAWRCGLIGREEPHRGVRLMSLWLKHKTHGTDAKRKPLEMLRWVPAWGWCVLQPKPTFCLFLKIFIVGVWEGSLPKFWRFGTSDWLCWHTDAVSVEMLSIGKRIRAQSLWHVDDLGLKAIRKQMQRELFALTGVLAQRTHACLCEGVPSSPTPGTGDSRHPCKQKVALGCVCANKTY